MQQEWHSRNCSPNPTFPAVKPKTNKDAAPLQSHKQGKQKHRTKMQKTFSKPSLVGVQMRTFQGSAEIPNPSAPGLALRGASAPPPTLQVKDLSPPGAWWKNGGWVKTGISTNPQKLPRGCDLVFNHPNISQNREECVRWVINAKFMAI